MMVSIWWVVAAFVVGGVAGLLLLALMSVAAREDERAVRAERAIKLNLLPHADLDLEAHFTE